ncbi:MAG: hypothetical protein OXK79_10240 [Chloroflexota bacterium]|nr:hypothetical protein [Chloroflexota bacterium]
MESWKAAFEEFGLLYVISRSDTITVTPAGKQFYDAVEANDRDDFVWIGLNLLFRYPLQGPPRGRSRSPAHSEADLLPYRFLHSAMRDLGDYFWWTELERVLCQVFSTAMAPDAVDAVRDLRANPSRVEDYPLPVDRREGAFYNSLNQVANHAGMNHLVLAQENEGEHYGPNETRRRHFINRHDISLVSAALGDTTSLTDCDVSASFVDRLPAAPVFAEEQAYFDYLGAAVPSLAAAGAAAKPEAVAVAGDTVFVLKSGEHFESVLEGDRERVVEGNTHTLCRVGRSHRVILSTDLDWTYLVVDKDLVGPTAVRLSLRRARPITNIEPIETLFGGDDG